ncbi:MAG TPA: hypothetical protein VM598_08655, partial [Bdellovibrionota bacterium]|nr:hypothetical protein [Bdellovibrionota bacterium]
MHYAPSAHDGLNRTARSISARSWLTIGLTALALTACMGGESGDGGGWQDESSGPVDPSCREDFEKTIVPFEIKGHQHLYFNWADLAFLFDDKNHIRNIELELDIEGKKKGTDGEVILSLNGYQSGGTSNHPYYRLKGYDSGRNSSKCGFDFRKMGLNGGISIRDLMFKIFKFKGELRISTHTKGDKIVGARLVLSGWREKPCASPAPSPTPSPSASAEPPVAPDTSIQSVSPTGSTVASTGMAIAFGSNQVNVTFACTLDGQASACASPVLYSGLANGSHSFSVAATNSAGLTDATPATYSWTIDTLPPGVTITNSASLPQLTRSGAISIEFASADAASFDCSIDGGAPAACDSPVAYAGLSEGVHRVEIRAVDGVGNRSDNPASWQWTIDQTAPATRLIQVDSADTISNATAKTFTFGSDEPSSFECSIDRAGFTPCQSPLSLENLVEGDHSFEVRATDLAGNGGLTASFLWRIDLTAPVLTIGQYAPAEGLNSARAISVEFSADEASTFDCALDGGAFAPCVSPFASPILTEGAHALVIVATDTAGNPSAQGQRAWV